MVLKKKEREFTFEMMKSFVLALASVAHMVGASSRKLKSHGFDSQLGCARSNHLMFLTHLSSLSLSLKSINMSSGADFLKKKIVFVFILNQFQ